MNKAIYPTFGLREMSWPKGDGYLYLALPGELEGRPIANFDLYKTTKEEFRQILKGILPTILARENISYYELKNFSPASELVFHEVAAEFGLASATTSAKVAVELRPVA
jgi:hypothetical protein